MLSIQKFSVEDIEKIKEIPKARKVYYLLFILCIPISFLIGLVGLLEKGHGYWPTTLVFLSIFFCVIVWLIAKETFLYRKDLAKQEKLTGTTKVISKSQKKNETIIYLDDKRLSKLNVYTMELFEKIGIGDVLSIEISKYSKYLFKLENYGKDLLNKR